MIAFALLGFLIILPLIILPNLFTGIVGLWSTFHTPPFKFPIFHFQIYPSDSRAQVIPGAIGRFP